MTNLKLLSKKRWALTYGFILAELILFGIGLALGLGRYVGGVIGLIIAGIWCFAGGLFFIYIPAFGKLAQK